MHCGVEPEGLAASHSDSATARRQTSRPLWVMHGSVSIGQLVGGKLGAGLGIAGSGGAGGAPVRGRAKRWAAEVSNSPPEAMTMVPMDRR